ncbi:protocadherin gamma-B1-like [Hyperolius riggenbachi]|uniref:protocadherin gamma-B1-like n=1 Tax=Hyperolius riggenbachi TaxID=752182 RepID=UPI0035A3D387
MKRTGIAQRNHHTETYKGIRWQVIFFFLISWLCHSVSGQIHYSIVEEMRKDSIVANIAKDLGLDIKQLSSRKLKIVSRVSEKYFYVNLDNGNLYVKDRIDRETLCGAEATCFLSFDAVVENPFNVFMVKVEIQDINDNAPVFYPDTFTVETIEITAPGTQLARFALQNAEDPDIGLNSVQSYKLSDNQHFSLNENLNPDGSTFLELVLDKPLDRETQSVHQLTLTALDGGKPVRSGSVLIKVIVTDFNDNFPVFSQQVYKISVSENTPVNTTITTINTTDKDEGMNGQVTYSFSKTSGNIHDSATFNINPVTGDIKTNSQLDYEITRNYEVSVQAKDGGALVSHCKVVIEVIDENDNAPEISITSISSPVPEDAPVGTGVAFIQIHDQDSGVHGEVDCKLVEEMPFSLLLSSSSYYKIVTTALMDQEKISSYHITILATDRGVPPLSSRRTITVDITDVNDNAPVFMKTTYAAYVPENNLPGASVYDVHASDLDSGENAKVLYSIYGSTEGLPLSTYLSINIETGVLYAQRPFDYEQNKEFVLIVTAKDNGSPSLSSNTTVIIHIVDQNDNAPKVLYPSPESGGSAAFEMVPFNSEKGFLITKVVAVDADSGHNAWLSYHFIQATEPSHFTINEQTGEIRTSRAFQEKDLLKHKVVVMVKDNGAPSLSTTVTLSLLVADNIQQVAPKLSNKANEDSQTNLQLYLVIALAVISFFFIIIIMLVFISKCKQPKSIPSFGALTTNLYPTVDPRIMSMYSDGTLSLPYSYNVCVALDSCENDFTYVQSKREVPVENLIDADDSGVGNESVKDIISANNALQVSI